MYCMHTPTQHHARGWCCIAAWVTSGILSAQAELAVHTPPTARVDWSKPLNIICTLGRTHNQWLTMVVRRQINTTSSASMPLMSACAWLADLSSYRFLPCWGGGGGPLTVSMHHMETGSSGMIRQSMLQRTASDTLCTVKCIVSGSELHIV